MSKTHAVHPSVKKYFRVKADSPRPGELRRIIRCKQCDVAYTFPWKPMSGGTVLTLLNHAYSHNVPQPKEETVAAYRVE